MVVGDDFHRLLDELVALILKLLAVTVFASVDTTTEVVVLRRGRRGPRLGQVFAGKTEGLGLPVTISRDNVVDPQLLADLLNAQM